MTAPNWNDLCPACKGYEDQEHRYDWTCELRPSWYVRLGRALQEFFNPRDWIPQFPIPRKPHPKAQGYQSLYEALRGFKKD